MNGEKSRTKRKGKILKAVGMLRDVVIDPIQIFVCPDAERHIIKRMVSAMRNEFASFVGVPLLLIKEKNTKTCSPACAGKLQSQTKSAHKNKSAGNRLDVG